ncbi:hypothetical protein ACJX0J_039833, partial [Zea mays]
DRKKTFCLGWNLFLGGDDGIEEEEGDGATNGGDDDFPHAYFFVRYLCDNEGWHFWHGPLPIQLLKKIMFSWEYYVEYNNEIRVDIDYTHFVIQYFFSLLSLFTCLCYFLRSAIHFCVDYIGPGPILSILAPLIGHSSKFPLMSQIKGPYREDSHMQT